MKIKVLLFVMVFTIAGMPESGAQIRSILRDKAREAILNKEEAGEEVKEEESRQQENTPRTPTALERRMEQSMMRAMGFGNLSFETQYEFNSSMSMDVETFDARSGENTSILYTTFFNRDDESFAMRFTGKNEETGKDENTLMVFDIKNQVMLMLAESEEGKTGMAFSIATDSISTETPDESSYADNQGEYLDDGNQAEYLDDDPVDWNSWLNKTGRTKTIAGYLCEEYLHEDEEGRTEYWFSPDAHLDFSTAYNYIGGFQALATGSTGMQGMLMEMEYFDKETKDRSKMIVRDINPNSRNTVDISDFTIMSLGGGD